MRADRLERLFRANELILVIATCGRKFLSYENRVARLEFDARGRLWYIEPWHGKRIYTHYKGRWRDFTNGGTLNGIVRDLCAYVLHGRQLHPVTFNPSWDLWAYGDDMAKVRAAATRLGITGCIPDGECG